MTETTVVARTEVITTELGDSVDELDSDEFDWLDRLDRLSRLEDVVVVDDVVGVVDEVVGGVEGVVGEFEVEVVLGLADVVGCVEVGSSVESDVSSDASSLVEVCVDEGEEVEVSSSVSSSRAPTVLLGSSKIT